MLHYAPSFSQIGGITSEVLTFRAVFSEYGKLTQTACSIISMLQFSLLACQSRNLDCSSASSTEQEPSGKKCIRFIINQTRTPKLGLLLSGHIYILMAHAATVSYTSATLLPPIRSIQLDIATTPVETLYYIMATRQAVFINKASTPMVHFSQAVTYQGMIYCSGNIGFDRNTLKLVGSTVREQTVGLLRHLLISLTPLPLIESLEWR